MRKEEKNGVGESCVGECSMVLDATGWRQILTANEAGTTKSTEKNRIITTVRLLKNSRLTRERKKISDRKVNIIRVSIRLNIKLGKKKKSGKNYNRVRKITGC